MNASRAAVYRALLDATAVSKWMVPDGMTSHVHAFDAREGGVFRISLTYVGLGTGKTSAHTDTFHGRFVKLVPNEQVLQVLEFETADPAMQGEMTIAYTLVEVDGGTDVRAVHGGIPPGVSASDNELGWRMSLGKLAALVEGMQSFVGIDHVQLAAPRGSETEARRFFGELLGLEEIPKPDDLAARGGCWFRCGAQELHVGIDDGFRPAKKAHPALRLRDEAALEALFEKLSKAGIEVRRDRADIEGTARFFVDDPFGNRLEILARTRDHA